MQNIFKRQHGFTLIEALFQLFVLLLVTQLLMSHQAVMQAYTRVLYSEDVHWEMFVYDMQRYIDASNEPFYVQYGERLTRKIYSVEAGKAVTEEFDVVSSHHYIRRQVNDGNEPLLFNVQQMKVGITGNVLTMRVTFLDGRIKERNFYVPT